MFKILTGLLHAAAVFYGDVLIVGGVLRYTNGTNRSVIVAEPEFSDPEPREKWSNMKDYYGGWLFLCCCEVCCV